MTRLLRSQLPVFLLLVTTGLFMQACTPKPYIPIRYQVPGLSPSKSQAEISFQFNDERPDPSVLSAAAGRQFSYFSGYYSLILTGTGPSEINLGAKTLSALFETAVGRLFESDGLRLASSKKQSDGGLRFLLQEFRLDYLDGKWLVNMKYEVALSTGKGPTATRKVTASGERRKILGTREAEVLIGEVFTEAINRMELKDLCKKAGIPVP